MKNIATAELENGSNILERYQNAQILEAGALTKSVAFNTTLFPHWIDNSDCFWYVRESKMGQSYRMVDAKAASNVAAFDHAGLAKALSVEAAVDVDPENLVLNDLEFQSGHLTFTAFDQHWVYHFDTRHCEKVHSHPSNWLPSPNGKMALFQKDYNLWVHDFGSGEEKPLTCDGERLYEYASAIPMSIYGKQGPSVSLEAIWSPDSSRVFTHINDLRQVEVGPPLVQHVPTDGSLRPKILQPDRRAAFAGDEHQDCYNFLTIDVESGDIQPVHYEPTPVCFPPYAGYFTGRRGFWGADSRHSYVIHQVPGGKIAQLLKVDTYTGKVDVIIEETSDSLVTVIPISHIHTLVTPLPETNELIWYSERSGSAHFYLYELSTGRLKNAITEGDWLVRNVLHFDPEMRELVIQTANRVKGRNPYYSDICRVNIDSQKLIEIVSDDNEYIVGDTRSRVSWAAPKSYGVSPDAHYIVATRSRVDTIPESVVFNRQGDELLVLETADVSGLPENWRWPEPLMLKAADGETDMYGVIYRPSNFDSNESYPVLDCTYGYSVPIGSFSNSPGGAWHYLSPAAYAELGFIVVVFNQRGVEGLRDNAFKAYQDPALAINPQMAWNYSKSDCIAGIKQLAERFSYIDLDRVGVVEFGSMPAALSAMLVYPEFYKVGVSTNAMAYGRMLGALNRLDDPWPELADFAGNLRGKLFIISGMLEWCMHASMTFRLIEALKNANKRFDLLMLPNLEHGSSCYTIQRTWDYLVEHLLGVEPPDDFTLRAPGWEAARCDLGDSEFNGAAAERKILK